MKLIITESQYRKIIKEDTQLEYTSEFLDGVTVVVVFEDDPLYEQVKTYFDEYGFGFMVPGSNLIIIDGEILVGQSDAKDLLKFIKHYFVIYSSTYPCQTKPS